MRKNHRPSLWALLSEGHGQEGLQESHRKKEAQELVVWKVKWGKERQPECREQGKTPAE